MRHAAGLLVAALAPVGTACDSGPIGLSNFAFSVGRSESFGTGPSPVLVTAVEAGIRILGEIGTPTACYDIEGRAVPRRGGIEVRVAAESTGGDCGQAPAVFPYEGILMDPDPGIYHVTVRHVVRSNSTIAFEGDIEVH